MCRVLFYKLKPLLLRLLLPKKFSEPLKSHVMCHRNSGDGTGPMTITYQEIFRPGLQGVCWHLLLTARKIKQTSFLPDLFFHWRVPTHTAGRKFPEFYWRNEAYFLEASVFTVHVMALCFITNPSLKYYLPKIAQRSFNQFAFLEIEYFCILREAHYWVKINQTNKLTN